MRERKHNSVQRSSASDIISAFTVPLFGAALYYSIQFLVIGAFAIFSGQNVTRYSGSISLVYGFILVLILGLAVYLTNKKHPQRIPFKKILKLDFGIGTFFALGLIGVSTLYYNFIQFVAQYVPKVSEAVEDYVEMVSMQGELSFRETILFSVATVVLIPVVEEFLFRGLIQGAYMKVVRPIPAIILSSLVFGMIHVQPIQVGYAFLCGLAIGSIYYLSGNILVAIFVHLVFNFFGSAVVSFWGDRVILMSWLEKIELMSIGIVAVSLVYYYRKKKSIVNGAQNEAES
ncbi:MAG TPA: CPBP family intramembrane metalloprotease [Clostridiaceae bacterium]|jgi:membrane protease YdiL (CAAX protease family)|nr:CPBP family intramembrane metalloprotease [Clostridiaceae bacterium]